MAQAQDYPITTGFGQVPGYPLNNGFHNGVDRSMPNGTPVIVNGVTIGLSNNTGASTGPHLHIGRYENGHPTNPGNGGFKFNSAVVFDTGRDATNGNFVRITGDGALWNYLHLQSISVTKGQVLTGGSVSKDAVTREEMEKLVWISGNGNIDSNPAFTNDIGNNLNSVADHLISYPSTRDFHLRAEAYDGLIAEREQLKKRNTQLEKSEQDLAQAVVDRDKVIAAQGGDVEATVIGRALIKLLGTFGYKKSN